MKWELLRPEGDIAVTVFAGDDKLLALLHHKSRDRSSIGEVTAVNYLHRYPVKTPIDAWFLRYYSY
jgi:hypothetical protein